MRVVRQTNAIHVAMRLVVFVDEFTLRAPLHCVLLDTVVNKGPAELVWASEYFPLEGEYTDPQDKYNGNYRISCFV
jgi:hypothetical protein